MLYIYVNYMPWMLCLQLLDVVSNECSVVKIFSLAVFMM